MTQVHESFTGHSIIETAIGDLSQLPPETKSRVRTEFIKALLFDEIDDFSGEFEGELPKCGPADNLNDQELVAKTDAVLDMSRSVEMVLFHLHSTLGRRMRKDPNKVDTLAGAHERARQQLGLRR